MSKSDKKKRRIKKEKERLANRDVKSREKLFPNYITNMDELYEYRRRYIRPLRRKISLIAVILVVMLYVIFMLCKFGRL